MLQPPISSTANLSSVKKMYRPTLFKLCTLEWWKH